MPYATTKEKIQKIDTDIFDVGYDYIYTYFLKQKINSILQTSGRTNAYIKQTINNYAYKNAQTILKRLLFISNYNYNNDTKNNEMIKGYKAMITDIRLTSLGKLSVNVSNPETRRIKTEFVNNFLNIDNKNDASLFAQNI